MQLIMDCITCSPVDAISFDRDKIVGIVKTIVNNIQKIANIFHETWNGKNSSIMPLSIICVNDITPVSSREKKEEEEEEKY
uniref:Uncharacterized protein n=1 Tax=Onchocerca volvulus TaxID=6282 RepID=A0A8R1XNG6_ONCVO